MSLRLIFNSLSISGAAMFAGVMFAIGVILGGYWRSLSPADFLEWFSRNNVFIMRAIPFVALPTFIGLGGSLWLGWNSGTERALWLVAAACIVGVMALTGGYYVPANAAFSAKTVALDHVPAKLDSWLLIHTFRIGLAAVASVLGVIAVSLQAAAQ